MTCFFKVFQDVMNRIFNRNKLKYILVIGLLAVLYLTGAAGPVEKLFRTALNPALSRVYSWGAAVGGLFAGHAGQQELVAENSELRDELNKMIAENAGLKSLEQENRLLRENLRFFADSGKKYVLADVISRGDILGAVTQAENLVIDKGRGDGIAAGQAVVNSQGLLVGKVSSVKDSTAEVTLVINSYCKLSAMDMVNENATGITEGELGLTVKMSFIPQDQAIAVGDTIVTSGLEEAIPRGLVIGRVSEVSGESNELWRTAQIEPLVNPNNLLIVSVIIP